MQAIGSTALVLAACDTTATPADAGSDAGSDAALVVASPAMPAPPATPHATCPTGWTMTHDPDACEPWPANMRPVCTAGQRLAAGGCVTIATDCADVPPEVAMGATYVLAGSTGGDGTLTRPFGSIAEALAAGATNLALGVGSYDLPTSVSSATIAGACPTTTTLVASAASATYDVTLRRLRLTGAGGVVGNGTLALDRVEITALGMGVKSHGSLRATGVEMHDVAAGFAVPEGALTFEDVSIEHVFGTALNVTNGTTVQLTRFFVVDMTASDTLADAILTQASDHVTLDTIATEQIGGNAMLLSANVLDVHDAMARDVAGVGIVLGVSSDDTSSVAEAWVDTAGGGGLYAADGTHTVTDVVVQNLQGPGIVVTRGTSSITRAWVDGAIGQGMDVTFGQLTISDVTVRNVGHEAGVDGSTGSGLLVENGSTAHVHGAYFESTEGFGVGAIGVGVGGASQLDIADVEIANVAATTAPDSSAGSDGYGILINGASSLMLDRAFVHDVVTVGVVLQGGTVIASDLTIQRVTAIDTLNGIGISAQVDSEGDPASSMTLTRADVSDVVRWGVLASGTGATLVADNLAIHEVHAAECCEEGHGGAALVVHDGATARVTDFSATQADEAGLVATEGVTVILERGAIHDNAVGMLLSPSLASNSVPGVVTHEVINHPNGTDVLNTETSVTPPSIALQP